MRVLWICTFIPGPLAAALGREGSVKEGWISGLLRNTLSDVELSIAFGVSPGEDLISGAAAIYIKDKNSSGERDIKKGCKVTDAPESIHCENDEVQVDYYSYHLDMSRLHEPVRGLRARAEEIISSAKPDIIHIFGMEYPQGLDFAAAFDDRLHTLVSIQGVMEECAAHFLDGIPEAVRNTRTLRDIIRRDSMREQQQKFIRRAGMEKCLLSMVGHAAGRTDFDRKYIEEFSKYLSPGEKTELKNLGIKEGAGLKDPVMREGTILKYHVLKESLRPSFYQYNKVKYRERAFKPHSIFVSQGDYPLKGLHMLLEALPGILDRFPDTLVTVGGDRITAHGTWKERLKLSGYGKYLLEIIIKNHLEGHVIFRGKMNEKQILEELAGSQVLVNPSAMENSSNSIGEAMMLGVPVVAARVGGTASILEDGQEGFLYDFDNMEELVDKITFVFESPEETENITEKARERALKNHPVKENAKTLAKLYREISDDGTVL